MNKIILKRMEVMIVKYIERSILFLLFACCNFYFYSSFYTQYHIYFWYPLILIIGNLFKYLGIITLMIPIFEFINLKRTQKENEQIKERNQKNNRTRKRKSY